MQRSTRGIIASKLNDAGLFIDDETSNRRQLATFYEAQKTKSCKPLIWATGSSEGTSAISEY